MNIGVEIAEMVWDLSIRAQSRRALTMNSVWLREEGDGDMGGIGKENRGFRMGQQKMGWKIKYGKLVDPVLGFNLEGGSSSVGQGKENSLIGHTLNVMDHDLEDVSLVEEEGKKRSRGEIEDLTGKEEIGNIMARSRRMVDLNHLSSVAAKWQADRTQ
ncbi:hypothetical protein ES332_D02G180600v1 [Gossypium tomentosum]|uniref:Uncharacterized protein n=1 Tax=Gossypium tomentosum TaxID=34277 RepID=A0A5D2LYR3_GOSTO|nr:hypothetical protein ES332_D02G180600v1 [Gossypium tomentosum]